MIPAHYDYVKRKSERVTDEHDLTSAWMIGQSGGMDPHFSIVGINSPMGR